MKPYLAIRFSLILILISSFIILSSLFNVRVNAAGGDGTLSVTPQITKIDLSKDAPVATFTYKNTTKSPILLTFSLKDFRELEEIGIPGFIDAGIEGDYKYGLSSWAKLSSQTLLLNSGEEQSITVNIDKTRVTSGGHYSSILAEIAGDENGKKVELKAVIAALIFVRSGSEFDREEGKIASIVPDSNYFSFPEHFILRFQNTGNVDVTPYGLIQIHDPFGKIVAKSIINENSLISLPETIRRYNLKTEKLSDFLTPGIYKADIALHFGRTNKNLFKTVYFFSLGTFDLKMVIVGIVVIVFVVIVLKKLLNKLKGGQKKNDESV